MAMPTEEKRVVKKVVVQPDGTKKVIKKIIRKVPKKETAEIPAPAEVSSPIEQPIAQEPIAQEPVSRWSMFRPTDDDTPSFSSDMWTSFTTDENQYSQVPSYEDNSTSAELFKEDPIEETSDEPTITQENDMPSENQETSDIQPESNAVLSDDTQTQNENLIDMWNLTQDNQSPMEDVNTPQEASVSVENAEWTTTLDMNSLLWTESTTEEPVAEWSLQPTESLSTEAPTLESSNETASVDLNQMVAQPQQWVAPVQQDNLTVDSQESQESFDPFMAMKTTLGEEEAAAQQQAATLDLNSMDSQDNSQQPQEVVNQGVASETPTLDLNAMPSELWSAPITSNVLKNLWGLSLGSLTLDGFKLDEKKKKLVSIGAACLWVVVLAAMIFIRYPDLFAGGWEEHGVAPTNPTDWQPTTQPTTQEPTTTGDSQTWEDPTIQEQDTWDNQGTTTQPDTEVVIKPRDPVIVWEEDFFKEDKEIPTVVLDETTVNPKTSSGAVDPLKEVTWIIWDLNGNDTIKQEALEYQQKGQQLRDKWASKNDRTIMRYWTFIEWTSREIIQSLEKGENIDISTWTSQKAQFDEYLQKGNNA